MFPAHIRQNDDGTRKIQSVETHCKNCARYARQFAPTSLQNIAYLAGLLHDMGKYTLAFSNYIQAAPGTVRRGSVNHSFAGVRFVFARWHNDPTPTIRSLTSEVLAFAIGSHHGQFDVVSPEGKDGFLHRITAEDTHYEEAQRNYLAQCESAEELDRLFEKAHEEIVAALAGLKSIVASGKDEELYAMVAMLARLLLSVVIEGDRRDTAEFMQGAVWAPANAPSPAFWQATLAHVEERLSALPTNTKINEARRDISNICRAAAQGSNGIYRLNVPTGGGKTLAALRFALAEAKNGKKRIFFVIPLLSVLEQNAAVLREYIGNDDAILEHHSNLPAEDNEKDRLHSSELLLETWQAPIVVTTLFQLLQSLFKGKNSCVRRMHALCGSVVVIDEVQSVPRNLLALFNIAMNTLAYFFGATIVLCSATQPCFEKSIYPLRLAPTPDIVPHNPTLWEVFRRTQIQDRRKLGGHTLEECAALAVSSAQAHTSVLVVCNTKQQARQLFCEIQKQWDKPCFHLSTGMCMAHRLATMGDIQQALAAKTSAICVATQLVEAGVDFSFGCVVRVLAGMDNIVQAAGRCNRNGECAALGPVYIVNIHGENLAQLKEIREAQQATESLLVQYARAPEIFSQDLTSDASIMCYYQNLYCHMKDGAQENYLPAYNTSMLALLSYHRQASADGATHVLKQAFKTAGDEFHVFEENTTDILVPHGQGIELIAELQTAQTKYNYAQTKALLKKATAFSISVYQHQLRRLHKQGGLYGALNDTVLVLQPAYYQETFGFCPEGTNNMFLEV